MALDTEAAIMANFEFLSREGDVDMEEDDDDEEMNDVIGVNSQVSNNDFYLWTKRRFEVKNKKNYIFYIFI